MKYWVASAEKLGKKPSDFKGQYVTLLNVRYEAFKRPVIDEATKKPKKDAEGKTVTEPIMGACFTFIADETIDSNTVKDYVRDLLDGKNETAARRVVIMDARIKQFPEYRNKLQDGTLAEFVNMNIVDGKFAKM